MTKVLLDFPNLRDSPNKEEYLDEFINLAKDAQGFCFFIDRGETCGLMNYQLNDATLINLISELERTRPGLKFLRILGGLGSSGR